jgi:eukaryotic-like serine/threonine-protein kinase
MGPPPDAALVGTVLGGRYRITGVIASGGMGAVYEGVQLGLERGVAIKVVHPFLAEDGDAMARFAREARAAGMLGHPNIVQVLDFAASTPGEPAWLALELIRGPSLNHLLKTAGPWSPERTAALLVAVLSALDVAHRHGVIHRDLKPGNIVVVDVPGLGPVPKLVDFGIAKLMDSPAYTRLTQTGAILGTPQYMAPEQAWSGEVDGRADLYAVAAIGYAMLTGAGPFAGLELGEVINAVRTRVPRPPSELRADHDARLDYVVMRGLAKERAHRFSTATEMSSALQAALGQGLEPTRERQLAAIAPTLAAIPITQIPSAQPPAQIPSAQPPAQMPSAQPPAQMPSAQPRAMPRTRGAPGSRPSAAALGYERKMLIAVAVLIA